MSFRNVFKEIVNFAFYYGAGELEKLAQFDVVIVEPNHLREEDIEFLHAKNTLVIAYLSVMEIGDDQEVRNMLQFADYIHVDGQPLIQSEYGTYVMNLNSMRWRGLLYHKAGRLIVNRKFDGLFLDTIGDVEDPKILDISFQIQGAVEIVETLRKRFPEIILIQNNGLEILFERTASLIDGLVWENAPLEHIQNKSWVENINHRILQLRANYGIKVLLLFEDSSRPSRVVWAKRRHFADTNEYLIYTGKRHYLGEVNIENR